jgi:hypothetical protein
MVLQRALSLILWGAGEQEAGHEEESPRYKPQHQQQEQEGPTTPPLLVLQPSQPPQPQPPPMPASSNGGEGGEEEDEEDELWSLPDEEEEEEEEAAAVGTPPPLSPPSGLSLDDDDDDGEEESSAAFYSPLPYYRPPRPLGSPATRALTLSRSLSAGGGLDEAALAAAAEEEGAAHASSAALAHCAGDFYHRPAPPSCEMPPAFRDPITQEVMADPVTAADGESGLCVCMCVCVCVVSRVMADPVTAADGESGLCVCVCVWFLVSGWVGWFVKFQPDPHRRRRSTVMPQLELYPHPPPLSYPLHLPPKNRAHVRARGAAPVAAGLGDQPAGGAEDGAAERESPHLRAGVGGGGYNWVDALCM